MPKIVISIFVPAIFLRGIVRIALIYRKMRYGYTFRRIKLTQGKYAIVDVEDFEKLKGYSWHAKRCRCNYYVSRAYIRDGKKTTMTMHRQIMQAADELFVDHVNHNGLDNRRANLRVVTLQQNNWNNRQGFDRGKSKYKGVKWDKRRKKWCVVLSHKGSQRYIGHFADEVEAARAYDNAAKSHRGRFAALNFK